MYTPLRRYYRGHTLGTMRDVAAGQSRYYHFDHQGTTQCLTDSTGAVSDKFAGEAWGVQAKRTGSSINRHWYVGNWGHYRHVDTLSDHSRARWLRPSLGRWLSADPLWSLHGQETLPGSLYHLYVYVHNRASRSIDPSGLDDMVKSGLCSERKNCCPAPDLDCAQMCAKWYQDHKAKAESSGGTILCYRGRLCWCVFPTPFPPSSFKYIPNGSCPGIDQCIEEHEKGHCKDSKKRCKCDQDSVGQVEGPGKEECEHRFDSVCCHEEAKKGIPNNDPHNCRLLSDLFRDALCTFLVNQCNPFKRKLPAPCDPRGTRLFPTKPCPGTGRK